MSRWRTIRQAVGVGTVHFSETTQTGCVHQWMRLCTSASLHPARRGVVVACNLICYASYCPFIIISLALERAPLSFMMHRAGFEQDGKNEMQVALAATAGRKSSRLAGRQAGRLPGQVWADPSASAPCLSSTPPSKNDPRRKSPAIR